MLTFKLSPQMVAVIGRALGAQPYDVVAETVAEMQRQVDAQRPGQVSPNHKVETDQKN